MNRKMGALLAAVLALVAGGAWFWAQPQPVQAATDQAFPSYLADLTLAGQPSLHEGKTAPPGFRWCRPEVTRQTFLAQALGISEDELEAAQQKASLAWLDYLEAQGLVAPKKAAVLRAGIQARPYLDPQALVARALGLTPQAVQQACERDQTLADLLAQQGLDRAAFTQALRQAVDQALQQAVDDGVITAEQAAALKRVARQRWEARGPRPRWP